VRKRVENLGPGSPLKRFEGGVLHFLLWSGVSDVKRDKERWLSGDLMGKIRKWLIKSGMGASKR
jgi:hypothetical protein